MLSLRNLLNLIRIWTTTNLNHQLEPIITFYKYYERLIQSFRPFLHQVP